MSIVWRLCHRRHRGSGNNTSTSVEHWKRFDQWNENNAKWSHRFEVSTNRKREERIELWQFYSFETRVFIALKNENRGLLSRFIHSPDFELPNRLWVSLTTQHQSIILHRVRERSSNGLYQLMNAVVVYVYISFVMLSLIPIMVADESR